MNTNYQIAPFFAEPFFVIPDFLDHDLRQILIRKVKKFSKKWEGQGKNAWASGTKSPSNSFHLDEQFHKVEQFDKLLNLVHDNVQIFGENLGVTQYEFKCTNAWYNSYTKHQFQEFHAHPNNYFSAIYFCDIPEGSSPIIFSDFTKMGTMLPHMDCTKTPEFFKYTSTIEFQSNTLLIFRSHLPHSVPFGKNEEERITFSFNFT